VTDRQTKKEKCIERQRDGLKERNEDKDREIETDIQRERERERERARGFT